MTGIRNKKSAKSSPDSGHIRNLQALDQAAGGSGDIAPEEDYGGSLAVRPDHGTDDARSEDSAERDAQRQRTADGVSARIDDLKTIPGGSASVRPRKDADIRAEISSRLEADGLLDAAGIFVTVSRGRVIIEGSVENHEAKQRAEAISRQASGIISHNSNLTVRTQR